MHYEYAVEPAAIGSSWETFLYLFEKFGFQKGRLISRFPGTWERQVIEEAEEADVPDVARARILEMLRQKKRTVLVKTGREYDPELQGWVTNALTSHASRPFRAIIAQDERIENEVVSPAELDADHPTMVAPISRDISRTAVDIAKACSLLLCTAREIDLVDPYFDLRNRGGNYRDPLKLMMRSLHAAGKENVKIRVHYRDHESRPNEKDTLQNASRVLKTIIPQGYELHMYAWRQRDTGEDLHDRYLLCDCGGMMAGAGFAASGAQENVTFSLLDDEHVQDLRSRYADGSTTYDQVGRTIRVKANGVADLI